MSLSQRLPTMPVIIFDIVLDVTLPFPYDFGPNVSTISKCKLTAGIFLAVDLTTVKLSAYLPNKITYC